ncbi:MAG: Yip1 family protein, partial [Gemmatimonadales bacterium]
MSQPTPASTPVPAPPSGGIPIVTDAVRLLRVLISPGAVFAEIQERPTFWVPYGIIVVFNAVLSYLQRPYQQRIAQLMTERAGRPFTESSAIGTAVSVVLSGALAPLILCAIVGGVLYVLVSMFGGQTTFKKMATVSIFTWPVTLLQLVVTWFVLNSRGVGAINGPQDLFVS